MKDVDMMQNKPMRFRFYLDSMCLLRKLDYNIFECPLYLSKIINVYIL